MTARGMASPIVMLGAKSTQDLLDRLVWLERRKALAESRASHWLMEANEREEQMTYIRTVLRERGVVDVPR